MFALNETAALHACVGQRGGRPAFAESGVEFSCRSEPAWANRYSGNDVKRVADTRIFAGTSGQEIDPHPGDRIALNGRYYRIAEVQAVRGWRGIHHLEILARDEGARDGEDDSDGRVSLRDAL